MKKLRAYFAHPEKTEVKGAAIVVEHWIEINIPELALLNPFTICRSLENSFRKNPQSITIAKAIVREELNLIKDSDFVVVYYPNMCGTEPFFGGFGTPMEMFYARHCMMKPVYALTPFVHPWLIALGVKCFKDVDEMIEEIKRDWKLE